MALVEAARYFNFLDAEVARSKLDAEGIMSFVFDTNMTWEGLGVAIGVRLMVDEEDLAAAQGLLEGA